MDISLTHFLRILRDEIDLYRDLVEHARRKTALLVAGRLEPILESNKIDETFNIKLRLLENELERLTQDLCRQRCLPREEFTLVKLAEGVEQSASVEIRSQANLFRNLCEQLRGVNRRNSKLIESSLRFSRGLADYISNATGSYQGTGLFKPLSAIQPTISRQA